jgi:hypothetical protein
LLPDAHSGRRELAAGPSAQERIWADADAGSWWASLISLYVFFDEFARTLFSGSLAAAVSNSKMFQFENVPIRNCSNLKLFTFETV